MPNADASSNSAAKMTQLPAQMLARRPCARHIHADTQVPTTVAPQLTPGIHAVLVGRLSEHHHIDVG